MGLIEVDASHKATIVSLAQYMVKGRGLYAETLRKHYSVTAGKSPIKLAEVFLEPETLETATNPDANPTKAARKSRRKFVEKRQKKNTQDWKKNNKAG